MPSKNPNIDPPKIQKPDPNKLTENTLAKKDNFSEHVFALPSEEMAVSTQDLMVSDGYFKNDGVKVVKIGSKVGTEYNSEHIASEDMAAKQATFVGRKGNTKWNSNVTLLKKKLLSFSWDKFSRNLAIFCILFGIVLVVAVSGVVAIGIDLWNNTPSIDNILRQPFESSTVYARDGKTKLYEFFGEERREVMPLSEIPRNMQMAMIALEDEHFYKNEQGIPWTNIAGAARDCLFSGGDVCRGASGISQQLMKNVTKDDDRSLDRKVRELFLSIKLNQEKNHSEVLEDYLNWVSFGRNAYGVQEASKAYFGRPINEKKDGKFVLTLPEACFLASMVQSPGAYPAGIGKWDTQEGKGLLSRKNICLSKLATVDLPVDDKTTGKAIPSQEELLRLQSQPAIQAKNAEEAKQARNEGKIAFVVTLVENPFPHFKEYVEKELQDNFVSRRTLNQDGLTITTTLDPQMQRDVEKIVKDFEPKIQSVGGNNAAAIVLDGSSGEILSMVGSLGYDRNDIDGSVNVATTPQQPGSSGKPYGYGSAWSNGFNPATILVDARTNFDGYTPRNFSGSFSGPVSMRFALQNSLNIPAVKALYLGPREDANNGYKKNDSDGERMMSGFFNFAEKAGVRYPCVPGASNQDYENGVETCKGADGQNQKCFQAETSKDPSCDWARAYRGRCYVATALGGCELTMVSHATGINTILHGGNLRTATPIISIKGKDTDGKEYDIYQQKQQEVYPKNDADPNSNFALVSKQVTNVMTDYETRAAEFGRNRFLLELNDKRWRVAAKTGTSTGPKDFWTVGGTPYYTVLVWSGRTDNKSMAASAASSAVAAPLWKQIMEYLHKGKAVKNFDKTGLVPVRVDSRTGYPSGDGNYTEYLTPVQRKQVYSKSGVIAAVNPDEIEKLKKKSIFENRSTLVAAVFNVNKLDKKLFVDGKTLDANKEEVKCYILVAEFPSNAWRSPVDAWADAHPDDYCKIPDPSDQDQVGTKDALPTIETNLANNKKNVNSISLKASAPAGSGKNINKTEIYIDGVLVASSAGDTVVFSNLSTYTNTAGYTVVLKGYDDSGAVATQTFTGITFGTSSSSSSSSISSSVASSSSSSI